MQLEEYIPFRLEELCQKYHYTRYRLSQLTGISQTALGNILSKSSVPNIFTLDKLCEAFGISLAQFFSSENTYPDLTNLQKEMLILFDGLEIEKRQMLVSFMKSLCN